MFRTSQKRLSYLYPDLASKHIIRAAYGNDIYFTKTSNCGNRPEALGT